MAGAQIASNLTSLMAKAETSYGSDPTPAAADGVSLRGPMTLSIDRIIVERPVVSHVESRRAHGVIDDRITFSFSVAVGGIEQTDGGFPGVHPFFVGGGYAGTLAGTEAGGNLTATYAPTSSAKGSYAMYHHLINRTNGQQVLIKMLGCRSNFELVVAANSELIMNVSGACLYAEWEPVAALTDPTAWGRGIASLMCDNITHSFNGTARRITAWNFATNYTVGSEDAVQGTTTAQEITLHRPAGTPLGGSINPVALATDFAASSSLVSESRSATEGIHLLTFDDGVSSFAYNAPKAQIGNLPLTDDASFKRFNVPYFNNFDSAGDDENSFVFGEI